MAGGGITTCGPVRTLPFWPDIGCTCLPPKSLYLVTMSPTIHRPSICLLTRRFVNALPHLVSVQRIDRTAFKDTFFFPPPSVCPHLPHLSAASTVGATGSSRQKVAVCSKEVLEPPSGSSIFSFHPREVWALPGPLSVPTTEEDEGNLSQSVLLPEAGAALLGMRFK